MGDAIKLRGHHLGVIYDLVAMAKGRLYPKARLVAAIKRSANRIYSQAYPASTAAEIFNILNKVFLEKARIEIVVGLDDICLSGCLQRQEADLKNKEIFEYIRLNLLEYVEGYCKNSVAQADLDLLKIYGLKSGEYSAKEIIAISRKLWKKFSAPHWDELIEAAWP